VLSFLAEPKQMLRAESMNTCTAGTDTNHSIVICVHVAGRTQRYFGYNSSYKTVDTSGVTTPFSHICSWCELLCIV